jgi:hypothetical protein
MATKPQAPAPTPKPTPDEPIELRPIPDEPTATEDVPIPPKTVYQLGEGSETNAK